MAVTAHDIRMKAFKRSYFRGYSAEDVDTFLMYLAVEMDRRERQDRGLRVDEVSAAPAADPIQTLNDELFHDSDLEVEAAELSMTPTAVEAPRAQPDPVPGSDEEPPTTAHLPPPPPTAEPSTDARAQADAIVAEARARAERGIERAKDHARQIVAEARRRQVEAERAESEASLRLAHLERQVTERAAALSAEARRLDALAASLAEHDLAPALEDYHTPAHAAQDGGADVVQFARTADD